MSPALVTLVTSHPPPTFLRWTPCARSSDRRSHCACSNSSAATGTLFPHTKLISKTTFPPLSNSTDDRTMITDHSLTRWCGQFFHKVSPTKEIWMVTRTCRLDFRPRQVSYIPCRVQGRISNLKFCMKTKRMTPKKTSQNSFFDIRPLHSENAI